MQSSCVSIEPLETKLGRKRKINQSTCNKDYTCLKGFCPSFVSVDAQLQARATSHKIDGLPDPKQKVSDGVSNIMLTGIGGTGVLTVSAITAMAAHYEGKESTILDMTGLAQKGGAVWSHIKIYEKNVKTFSHKIAPASANLFLGCDAVVGTKPEIQEVLSDKKTYSIINSDTIPVADFVTNRDLDFKDDEVLKVIDKTTKDIDITVPAIKIAENLCGDAIAANIMMLGAAYQLGHIPLKEESIKYAIKLNGIGVEKNIYSFNLGRLYAFNPKDKIFKFLNSFKEKEQTSESILKDRLKRLAIYDKKEIDFFNNKINFTKDLIKNELETEEILKKTFKEIYRVIAVKDEYEVARMHLETSKEMVSKQFGEWKNLSFYLSPPFMSFIKDKRTGRPLKIKIPGTFAIPMFKLLKSFKFLRGSFFDPFQITHDRRRDNAHRKIFFSELEKITKTPSGLRGKYLEALVESSSSVRGYGPVKDESFQAFKNAIKGDK